MKKGLALITFLYLSCSLLAQKPDTLIKKLDSLSKKTDSAGGQVNNTKPAAYNESTKITFPSYFILLGSDIKQAFTKPFHMTKQDWITTGKFALVAGGLSLLDEPIQHKALQIRNNSSTLRSISAQVTNFGGIYEGYTLAALGAYGYVFHNDKMQTTTWLATQAYITGGAIESVLKFLSGRARPYFTDSTKVQAEPTFYGPFYKTPKDPNGRTTNSSFPSGHTTVAFAAATVFAMEYHNKPLVPIVAYSAATLIGLSRIAENKHWATDVLTGAAVGYLTGKLVVNNYHRYAKLKAPQQKKNTVTFNLQYNMGTLMPGLTYTFR
ncbi:MAG TPA: phosphatase PAP2 family protein [Flavisolibacter sp.]